MKDIAAVVKSETFDINLKSDVLLRAAWVRGLRGAKFWAMLLVLASPGVAVSTTVAKQSDCDVEFADVMESQRYPDLASKATRWESLAGRCAGSGIYESRLGTLYTELGRFSDAAEVIRRGLSLKSGHEKNLLLALSEVDFRQNDLAGSEKLALELMEKYADWYGGYIALGETRLVQHRFEEGIANLERANVLEPSSGAYSLLAMAYYQVHRPRDSAAAMQKAIRMDPTALGRTQAVCATAFSLVELGYVREADELLKKHLSVKPSVADDKTFRAASELVRKRLAGNTSNG